MRQELAPHSNARKAEAKAQVAASKPKAKRRKSR
jgi:hypothetical protein